MTDRLVEIADGFWNVRGSFKLAGLLDVGTQCSLVRLKNGEFIVLDSYRLTGEVEKQVLQLTDQGRAVRAILNLHPFHTVHVRASAQQFPNARLYGTRRHKEREPTLRWETLHTDDPALHAQFADDLAFSVPRGVDFIPKNEALHFTSVLVLHKHSGTLHVDDTLSWNDMPLVGGLSFHPTLRFALQKRPGAASEFRAWTQELVALSENARQICTAHARALPSNDRPVAERVRHAVAKVTKMVDAHERRHG
jgi:hypothetical protein